MTSTAEDRLHALWEHQCIRQVLERYCRGCDRMDKALVDGAFWPDAAVDLGPWTGKGADVAARIFPGFAKATATMHSIYQSNIELSGDTAHGDTYFIGFHRHDTAGRISLMRAFGRYVDRLEKRGGEWRISRRTVIMEHIQEEADIKAGDLTMDMFRLGKRGDRSDLSYTGRQQL